VTRSIVLCTSLLLLACEREPPIVIRFDPVDLSGRDLARPRDLAGAVDAAPTVERAVPAVERGTCASHADCVAIVDGCCDCAHGGKQRAVPRRNQAKQLFAQRASCGKDVLCVTMMSNDASCRQRAACVDHVCAMRGP
jgi:hypothetical protein